MQLKKTKASLLFGEESVSIGFVDGVLSFDDLLESLIMIGSQELKTKTLNQGIVDMIFKKRLGENKADANVEVAQDDLVVSEDVKLEDEKDQPVEDAVDDVASEGGDYLKEAVEITDICYQAGMSAMTSKFLNEKMTVEQVKQTIDMHQSVEKICTLAGKKNLAQSYIDNGFTLKQVQDDLISKMEQSQEDISNKQTPQSASCDVKTAKNVILEDIEKRKLKQTKGDVK